MASTIRGSDNFDTSPTKSMVRVQNDNGNGSTNTKIRRFSTTVTSQGSDITYADTAAAGASFTINTSGVYAIGYSDNFSAAGTFGISKNSSQLTTDLASITAADRLCAVYAPATNASATAAWTGYLSSGDVIRPHSAGGSGGVAALVQFTITKVAN